MTVRIIKTFCGPAAPGACAGGAAAAAAGYGDALTAVKQADLSAAFADVVVKDERPTPWPIFVDYRYRELKGGGRLDGGDLARDADAAVWLAVLDDGYRTQARLLFVKGGKIPAIPYDRWISLAEFENEIMPALMSIPGALDDPKVEEETHELVTRATALNNLSWQGLELVPGPVETGWAPVGPEHPAWGYITALKRAYESRQPSAMHEAGAALGAALSPQEGYPPPAKVKLEVYLAKFGVLKIGFFLYIFSALFFFVWAGLGRKWLAAAGAWVAFAGFVFYTVGLAGRSIVAGYLPTTGMYEYLSLFSWAAVLFFLLFYVKTRQPILGAVVMPVAFILTVLSSLFPSRIEGQLIPALQSWWLTIHVTLACLAEGAFAVAFAGALLYLIRGEKPSKYLPSKETLDVLEYRAVAIGFPLFTIGALVAGAIWAQKAWSVWWSWDPKETASLVVFLVAVAYLHARRLRGWRGNKSAVLAMLIFVASVLTLFSNMIFGGLHAYGV